MDDLTGRQFGPYQIVGPVGEGGMAAVYKAYQPSMERYVALKILPRTFAENPQFVSRFKREAKLLAQLQHPHILPVFDFGMAEGYTYIVMPFIQGGKLTDLMKGEPLPLARIRQVINQVGDALDYAHERGMIHRDVKPSNVLIDERGNCLLTDFGLARMVEDSVALTSTGTIMGTPAYMSPEQGSGQKIDARSDIYSLGVVLFEMATGRVPYRAETPVAVVFKHIQDPLPLPRKVNPDLPEAVERVIFKALAKRPEDRFQSAADFAKALDAAILPPFDTGMKENRLQESAAPISGAPNQNTLSLTVATVAAVKPPVNDRTVLPVAHQSAKDASVEQLKEAVQADSDKMATRVSPAPVKDHGRQFKKVSPWVWRIGAFLMVLLGFAGVFWTIKDNPSPKMVLLPTSTLKSTKKITPRSTLTALPTIGSQTTRPSFLIRLTTTSDFASVTFDNNGSIASSNNMAVSGNPSVSEFIGQKIHLFQDINLALAGHQISSTYEVNLHYWNQYTTERIGLSMNTGCIGQAAVELLNAVVDPPVVVFRKAKAGCQDISFSVPIESLKSNSPKEASMTGPPWPVLPVNADTDKSKVIVICADNQQLCTIKVHSGQLVQVTEDFNYAALDWRLAWSADGDKIFYKAETQANGPWVSYMINADGSGITKLPVAGDVSWSPDNQTIAYSDDDRVLRLMKPDGTERHFLNTPGVRCIRLLRWSPDNSKLAFYDCGDQTKLAPSVWVINRDGTNLHLIYQFNIPLWDLKIAWSPDGQSVGVWYQIKENDNVNGLLLDAAGVASPKSIEWNIPVWWTPPFWPQWGR